MASAFTEAGLPPGLLQVVTGKGSVIGDHLTAHPKASCISFTGGDTGLKISTKSGMVPLQMELGGKDVCIVCADADLDLAAKSIVKGARLQPDAACCHCLAMQFDGAPSSGAAHAPSHARTPQIATQTGSMRLLRSHDCSSLLVRRLTLIHRRAAGGLSYQGQRCTAVKVVMAVEGIADALVGKVKAAVDALSVGRPEDDCDVCHVISASSADYIEELVKGASSVQ
jgi:acyl-CoA reductase-like NAD-dependent aldehyde dehydrogenase